MDLENLTEQTIALSREVGGYIRQEAQSFDHHTVEEKGLNDLVSYVDKTAEMKIVEGLRKILPEAGYITEEGTAAYTEEEYRWVVDPLDGTTNFTHGLPVYAVSIALMHEDELVVGVVYEINKDEMFSAARGQGAWLNGKPISVSSREKLSESLLATGFPYYNFEQMSSYLKILNEFMKKTHGLRRMGSAAVDLAYVACGRFEGFFEYNLNAWDVAAGSLIVKEAGGEVTDFNLGNKFLFDREIIAGGNVLKEMQGVIAKYWN
jgi:myo-inositol-1(or 4)-monophosphatase